MRATVIIILFVFSIFRCKSQNVRSPATELNYEIVNAFFNQFFDPISVEKGISYIKDIKTFRRGYMNSKRIYDSALEKCASSQDTTILKLFCPIAYNYRDFHTSIEEKDVESFERNHAVIDGNLDFSSITNTLVYHYKIEDTLNVYRNHSRIKMHNVILNDEQDKALVVFSRKSSLAPPEILYVAFVLEKGIWWRRLGAWPL